MGGGRRGRGRMRSGAETHRAGDARARSGRIPRSSSPPPPPGEGEAPSCSSRRNTVGRSVHRGERQTREWLRRTRGVGRACVAARYPRVAAAEARRCTRAECPRTPRSSSQKAAARRSSPATTWANNSSARPGRGWRTRAGLRSGAEHGRLAHADGAHGRGGVRARPPGDPRRRPRSCPRGGPRVGIAISTHVGTHVGTRARTRRARERRSRGGGGERCARSLRVCERQRRRAGGGGVQTSRGRGALRRAPTRPFAANSAQPSWTPCQSTGPVLRVPGPPWRCTSTTRRGDTTLPPVSGGGGGRVEPGPRRERETVLEHGELVAALLCVRSLHNEAAEASEAEDGERRGRRAGAAPRGGGRGGRDVQAHGRRRAGRPAVEVCYSRHGHRGRAAPRAGGEFRSPRGRRARPGRSLHNALRRSTRSRARCSGALGAAAEFRAHRASLYPPAEGGDGAAAQMERGDERARALRAAASAAATLREEAASGAAPDLAAPLGAQAPRARDAAFGRLRGERLVSRARHGGARARRARNTWRARDGAHRVVGRRAGGGGSAPGRDCRRSRRGVTADAVAAVAEAHFGYEQLAEVCEAAAFEAESARDPERDRRRRREVTSSHANAARRAGGRRGDLRRVRVRAR